MAPPKRPAQSKKVSKRPRKASTPDATAVRVANGVLLAHFPFRNKFGEWIGWGSLRSPARRGAPVGKTFFQQLRGNHVFAYAGPPCFGRPDQPGDAVAYFGRELDGLDGFACPFDTGSLEPPNPRLQPWAKQPEPKREKRVTVGSVALAGWRAAFALWLTHCYPTPMTYLDTVPDAYAAGTPARTIPASLLPNNGKAGRARHRRCADRRAWTWEIRSVDDVELKHMNVVHVARHAVEKVTAAILAHRLRARVRALPRGVAASHATLFEHAGQLLRDELP